MKKKLVEKEQQKQDAITEELQSIKRTVNKKGVTKAPLIQNKDLDFIATTKVKLSQKDILKMYVGNWAQLDLRQRRKVMGYVQAQRSKHAKQIFLKELSAIGRKMD